MMQIKEELLQLDDEGKEERMERVGLEEKLQATSLAVLGQLTEAINKEACGL